jgi:hypothetical protein
MPGPVVPEVAVSRISKTLLSTTVLGNFEDREDEFHIRIWGDEHENGITWIDFEVFEVEGVDRFEPAAGTPRLFQEKGATSNYPGTSDLATAEPVAHGFVKWDGCTQFDMDAHVDGREQLEALFKAVCHARKLAAEAMPGKMINDEY